MIGRAINHHDLGKSFIKWTFLYSLEKKAFERKKKKKLESLKGRLWKNIRVFERIKRVLEKGNYIYIFFLKMN